ncbi:MAG TPA: glycosyltransferase family 4 protein [Vicinamibacterales bacterium]|nr:glycosyltransferase family 4 protein [Vicinamibacterales bacterium]
MRVVVAEARIPFARDGAELHAQSLVTQLRLRGHEAESVALPFHGRKHELLEEACAWRMLNLSSSNARPIDLLIATRFPTWFARHPRKVVWLIHQHRPAYDLYGTPYSDFTGSDEDTRLREQIAAMDCRMFAECRTIVTNAKNTADRLHRFNGLAARPLYHPPPIADRLHDGAYGDYILLVSRLEPLKRVDLAIGAMTHVTAPVRLVIVGDGSQRAALEREAAQRGVANRITFAGALWGDAVADLYAGARGVLYAPFDEDYGYVTLEAFLAARPVITATDSGGTLEFVRDGVNGLVCAPEAPALAAAIDRLAGDRALAERLGRAGQSAARTITWDGVIEQLLG